MLVGCENSFLSVRVRNRRETEKETGGPGRLGAGLGRTGLNASERESDKVKPLTIPNGSFEITSNSVSSRT